MTIKEYLRKNYPFMLHERPMVIVIGLDSFYFDNIDKALKNDACQDLLDHDFMFFTRAFDLKNRETYAVFGRYDI